MLDTLKTLRDPESRQFQVRLSHSQDRHARIGNLVVVAALNRSTGVLDVLAQGINVRGLKTKEVGQSNNAMVVDNASSNCPAESKVDEHLAHHLVHVFGNLDRKLRKETKLR